jgi:hypothetical protein
MNSIVIVIIICCLNILLWLFFFIQFKKKYSPKNVLAKIKQEVDKLLVEINRETDRDISLLEARIRGLKTLMDEADRRIALAEQEEKKRGKEQQVLQQLQSLSAERQGAQSPLSRAATGYRQQHQKEPELFNGETDLFNSMLDNTAAEVKLSKNVRIVRQQNEILPSEPVPGSTSAKSVSHESATVPEYRGSSDLPQVEMASEVVSPGKSLRSRILELSSGGFSVDIIADKLHVSVTEVQLIVDLYGA